MATTPVTRKTHRKIHTDENCSFTGTVDIATLKLAGTTNYGLTGALPGTVITQTYSTAAATVAALTYSAPAALTYADPAAQTSATLTLADGVGTNDGAIGAITDNASTITAVQELAAMINKTVADITAIRAKLVAAGVDLGVLRTPIVALGVDVLDMKKNDNQIINDLQAVGIEA